MPLMLASSGTGVGQSSTVKGSFAIPPSGNDHCAGAALCGSMVVPPGPLSTWLTSMRSGDRLPSV
jgi:hypothetical protein